MIQVLIDQPLLLLFVVAALGYLLGRVKVAGSSLGVAAVLFVGLAFGALDPNIRLPELLYQLGLVLFVYTVGLSSGPSFFGALRRKGLRDNLLVVGVLIFAAGLTAAAASLLRLRATFAAGVFAGSLTNTPALAGVLEYLKAAAPATVNQLLTEPVVAYSVTYPMGVVGTLIALALAQRLWKINYAAEAKLVRDAPAAAIHRLLQNCTIRVTRAAVSGQSIRELCAAQGWDVVFGRVRRAGHVTVADEQMQLQAGDLVTIVGTADDLERVGAYLGERSDEQLNQDRSELDYRRVFISNPKIAGQRLGDLNLPQQFGAVITRIRRGDVEFVPHADSVLELGDRVRVLTPYATMAAVGSFLGDSYRALSEIDFLSFSLGLALGLLLGLVPIPLPGGLRFTLGLAGGPLIVALVLGALQRSGPLVWSLPYSANLTLRQVGLVLFLAGVGTRAGYAFLTTFTQGAGLPIFGAGVLVTTVTAWVMLWLGYRVLKIPMGQLAGMLAGMMTQPAVLGFALESSGDDLPNVGYASVYPFATIAKIVLAQLLLALLR
ncbi:MAG: aspartate:alanine exchanger family transporter [Anaerolineales bacterium]